MSEHPFIIVGGGGHARVVASTLRELGEDILGFTDPNSDASLGRELEHLGSDDVLIDYASSDVNLTVGIGSSHDVTRRAYLFDKVKNTNFVCPPVVHPDAFVASEASIGIGSHVMAGAVMQAGTALAENVIVNTNATIDHDCEVGAHAHVAPGATVSGEVSLGARVHIGTGASLIQGVHVGARSVVGAGAVVTEDVPSDSVVVGVPAVQK